MYSGILEMPSPDDIVMAPLSHDGKDYCLPLVRFPGIGHIILTEPMEDSFAEKAIVEWCTDLGLDALGIMRLDTFKNTLRPLVYVKAINSLFWESSCASGTCAAAAWLSAKHGAGRYDFAQPGGILGASVDTDNGIYLKLIGNVALEEKILRS